MDQFQLTRVLCPTDMSDVSQRAVRIGLAWAKTFGAKVSVLFAQEFSLPPRYFTAEQVSTLLRESRAGEEQLREELEAWVEKLNPDRVPVEAIVGPGPADRAILRAVEVVTPDLVVMGSHGRSGATRFLMGSTTEKVVREIPVPVLVVPAAMPDPTPDVRIRRILCAADRPEESEANVATVSALARRFRAHLTVLHSVNPPAWLRAVPPDVRRDLEQRLQGLIHAHAADLAVQVTIADGKPAEQILAAAAREQSDLIIVGGRRPTVTTPAFHATAIRVMRQATCPVLALPEPAP